MTVPEGITLVPLPSRRPELQPAERLWGPVDCAVANRVWATIDDLEDAVVRRCGVVREGLRDHVHRLTRYHWWPDFA